MYVSMVRCALGTTTPFMGQVALPHHAQEGIIVAFDSMAGRYHVRLADNGVRLISGENLWDDPTIRGRVRHSHLEKG